MPTTPLPRWRVLIAALLLALALGAGCSLSARPQRIAAYPRATAFVPPIATYVPPPANVHLVYDATLTLDVANVDAAARAAQQAAFDHGGYLASSQSSIQDGRTFTTLTLAVPETQYGSIRRSLFALGTLVDETHSARRVTPWPGNWTTFVTVTVNLRPAHFVPPPLPPLPPAQDPGWSPVHTFQRAFGVFAAIFQFLADIAIWGVVVIGPFVVIGMAVWRVVQRRRHREGAS